MVQFKMSGCIINKRSASDLDVDLEPSPRYLKRQRGWQWQQYLQVSKMAADEHRDSYLTHARKKILKDRKTDRPLWLMKAPPRSNQVEYHFMLPSRDDVQRLLVLLDSSAGPLHYSAEMEDVVPTSPCPSLASTASFTDSTASYTISTAPSSPVMFDDEMDCEPAPAFMLPTPAPMPASNDTYLSSEPIYSPLPEPEDIEVDEVAEIEGVGELLEAKSEERPTPIPPSPPQMQSVELSQGAPCQIVGQISPEELEQILVRPPLTTAFEPAPEIQSEPAASPELDTTPKRTQETTRDDLCVGLPCHIASQIDPAYLQSILADTKATQVAPPAPKAASNTAPEDETATETAKRATPATERNLSSGEAFLMSGHIDPAELEKLLVKQPSSQTSDAASPSTEEAPSSNILPTTTTKCRTKSSTKAPEILKPKSGVSKVRKSTKLCKAFTTPRSKSGRSIAQMLQTSTTAKTALLNQVVSGDCGATATWQLVAEGQSEYWQDGGDAEKIIADELMKNNLLIDPESVFGKACTISAREESDNSADREA